MIEMHLSIICSCLATYPSLFRHFRRDRSQNTSYGYKHSYSRPLNGRSGPVETGNSTVDLKRSSIPESDEHSIDKLYQGGSGHMMNRLGPVHVQTEVSIGWDEEAQTLPRNDHHHSAF